MKIYMDHAATTPVDPKVIDAMKPFFSEKYGNASSLHQWGREAKEALEESRAKVAKFLGVKPSEIVFTSGGTESNNMVLKGTAFYALKKGKHIITTAIEHPSVISTANWLKSQGFDVTFLPVDKEGFVSAEELENSIRDDTILVSVMAANNEIGTIEPIEELGKIAHEHDVPFHTDAVQAFGKIPLNLENVDFLSASSHKIYGPKGVGLALLREGTKVEALLNGGGHEGKMRSGTENVAGIVGFAKAVELAEKDMQKEGERQAKLQACLIEGLSEITDSWLNGPRQNRLPNNINFSFKYIEGESLILRLDEKGIAASTGSACSSHELRPSHVLTAIGLTPEEAHGSLRLTLGKQNDEKQVDYVLENVKKVVSELRELSPLAKEVKPIDDKCFG
ncbi:MAG: cysteine desulfurase [Candidatus Diapherotrites archaeon]|nr:cysteine desulfurase [Candidatus Diapherotrites archaeon]